MSEPKRYSIVADFQPPWAKMHEFRSGDWVKWQDYARLKAELERLKNTDPNSISGSTIMSDPAWSIACFRFHRENERAEIARLRKAGDELERVLVSRSGSYEAGNASHEWQAAKKGKQP